MTGSGHFDHRAATYDDWWLGTGASAGHERPGFSEEVEQLVSVVKGLPPARVLDVACGTGFLTQHLRGEVTGLDRSGAMLEIAAARLPAARLLQAEALPLPFEDGEFDRVFTSLFLHHLAPEARAEFLAEARRVASELVVVEAVHGMPEPAFTAAELAGELDGDVVHESRWFVVVRNPTAG